MAKKPELVVAVYEGPHGAMIVDQTWTFSINEPLEVPKDVLERLQGSYPDHSFRLLSDEEAAAWREGGSLEPQEPAGGEPAPEAVSESA